MKQTIALVSLVLLLAGCRSLDPNGPYKSNQVLYNADVVITTSYEILHGFVLWEFSQRANLPKEVSKSADHVRAHAKEWVWSAIARRDAYAANPTGSTEESLNTAIALLRAEMVEATKYMNTHEQP